MKIKCENPVLIFNPNLRWLVSTKCHMAYFNGRYVKYRSHNLWNNFPWKDFYEVKELIDESNIDLYYVIDDDGLFYPMFMYVPCGKCRLCRDKQCNDWETRCMCESQTSPYPPLFITLTYAAANRPPDMRRCYDDFVLFMKRLRMYVYRRTGENRELRYLAASEWTPKGHYAHIHMILWNMPFISPKEGDKDSFWALINFVQDECWQLGITRVERCRDVSGAYCLKYIRKGVDPDCWKHASRRNGIGYDFAMSLLPTVLENPDMMSFQVLDGTGKPRHKAIPAYFKRLWYPTLSVLFPAQICKAAKDFHACATRLYYFMYQCYDGNSRCSDIARMVGDVMDKYRIMHIDFDDAKPDKRFAREVDHYVNTRKSVGQMIPVDLRRWSRHVVPVVDPSFNVLSPHSQWTVSSVGKDTGSFLIGTPSRATIDTALWYGFRLQLCKDFNTLLRSYKILMKYKFDEHEFQHRLAVTLAHQDYVRSVVENLPEQDINNLIALHERDQQWIATHWMQSDHS